MSREMIKIFSLMFVFPPFSQTPIQSVDKPSVIPCPKNFFPYKNRNYQKLMSLFVLLKVWVYRKSFMWRSGEEGWQFGSKEGKWGREGRKSKKEKQFCEPGKEINILGIEIIIPPLWSAVVYASPYPRQG